MKDAEGDLTMKITRYIEVHEALYEWKGDVMIYKEWRDTPKENASSEL
jgi:hypothetical protein